MTKDSSTPTPDQPQGPTPDDRPTETLPAQGGGDLGAPPVAPAPAPASATAAPATAAPRRRTGWIIGGTVAGVALVVGGIGLGVLIGAGEEQVVVARNDTTGQTGIGTDHNSQGSTGAAPTDGSGTASGDSGTGTSGGNSVSPDVSAMISGDRHNIELDGDTLTRAVTAAMQAADGEGVVTSAERSDDPTHVYELEVTRADQAEMEVYLDADFLVIATKTWHF